MDFYPTGCGSVAAERSWMTAVANSGGPFRRDCPSPCLATCWCSLEKDFASSQQKKSYGRDICFWRNCDSVQHDKNKVLLFPLKLIIKRVEFIAVNFIVFLQVVLFFSLPCLFLLDFWEDSVFAI